MERERRIILASGSAVRKMILDALMIPYVAIPADIDEKAIRDADLKVRAVRLARAKAEAVASAHDGIVIAGDTFCVLGGRALEKPASLDEAREMLAALSHQRATVLTSLCYLDRERAIDVAEVVEVAFTLRELSQAEIDYYVNAFPVLTWAAAFSPTTPYGASLVASIDGSLTGFVYGLPVDLLIPLLGRSGKY